MSEYGILTIVPPILTILLAIFTKNIIVSLSIGSFVGVTILSGWNPFTALYSIIVDYLFVQMADSYNVEASMAMVIAGGSAALITAAGGALAFKNHKLLNVFTKSRSMAEFGTWIGGIFIWFNDNANSLIVGPVFDTVNNNAKVSKEKFSYLLDCTTSPIVSLVPIMGWGIYCISLIEKEIQVIPSITTSSFSLFVKALPYSTYAILTLIMSGFIALSQWDFGPMLKAQLRAEKFGKLNSDDATPMRMAKEITLPPGVKPRLITLILPLAAILLSLAIILPLHGFPHKPVSGTDMRATVAYGFIMADILLCIMMPLFKIATFTECIKILTDGMCSMMYICIILLLAWSLGSICKNLGTAKYIMQISAGVLNPMLLPMLLFIISAIVSFATGTSWGSYALFIPIVVPLSVEMGVALPVTLGAVFSGGLFGDHCSPISDTTILAAMGSGADLIDHFKTQMPYAIFVGAICTVLYMFNTMVSPYILLVAGTIIMIIGLKILHTYCMKKYASEFNI